MVPLWIALGLAALAIALAIALWRRPTPLPASSPLEADLAARAVALEAARAEVAETRVLLEHLIARDSTAILLVDETLRIVQLNLAAAPLINRPLETLGPATSLREVATGFALTEAVRAALESGSTQSSTLKLGAGKGVRYEAQLVPVQLGGRPGVLGLFVDTSSRAAFAELRREFVTNVTHELKTPLTNIQGATETLLSGAASRKVDRERFLDIIRRNTEQLGNLISDLLTIARSEEVVVRAADTPADYDAVRASVIHDLQATADAAQVGFQQQVLAQPLRVAISPTDLYAVLKNLVENGIRYNRAGGVVEFSERLTPTTLEVRIRDTGVGISEIDLPRVFERFYRADKQRSRATSGTGLGLAIAKNLTERSGGQLSVESRLGYGSTFILELPLAAAAAAPARLSDAA